ncbi:hypothetical protein [Streptacidiphilus carbonis]|uniref:hypothetical protein n=1 Tax=Streptacidiphilus carbonis TaxID=105422 RepID=UPI0005A9578F|nr:hypothetical protein [Streptacidiphilus carbonis]
MTHRKEYAITRTRQAALVLACTVALAGGVAACGAAKQLSAGAKVSTAFDKLGESKSLSVKFSLDATADQLLALDKAEIAAGDESKSDAMTAQDAKNLAGLGASITMSADKPLKDVLDSAKAGSGGRLDPGLNFALELHGGDAKPLFELRVVNSKDYLRVDLDELSKLGSSDKSLAGGISGMKSGVAQLPSAYNAVKDLVNGRWVSIDPKQLSGLTKSLGGGGTTAAPSPSALPSLSSGDQNKLVKALTGVFTVDVTLDDKGTQDGKDHIVVTAPARKLVADIQNAVEPIVKDVPTIGSSFPTAAPTSVPDKSMSADVYINNDGSLSKLSLDVWQLNPKGTADQHLPLSLSFDTQAAPTTAPAGATELTSGVIQDMLKGMGAGSSDGSGGPLGG